MEWKIKSFDELTTTELYDILTVRSEVFVVEQTCIYLDCDGKDKESDHLFTYENEKVIAYARILPKGISYKEVSIGRVLVHPEFRGKGYGEELMKKAISFIVDTIKESTIRISAQAYLQQFYEGLGFKAVSEQYLEDDIPHIEMVYKR